MTIQFILVEPRVPENIGASARAIKTMGFKSLRLVNPCTWNSGKAKWVAHGSSDVLDNAIVSSTLAEALAGSELNIATSAKQRTVKQDYIPLTALKSFISDKYGSVSTISLVFGREESGLTNEEMSLCDVTSSIEMARQYPSLNLSQAVMLFAYELSGLDNLKPGRETETVIDENSFLKLKIKIRDLLYLLGMDETDNRFGRIMERISFMNHDDINLLHTLSTLINTKINKSK